MNIARLAEQVAREAHEDQTDKAGAPYVEHLKRVANIFVRDWPDATDAEIAIAWLHDIIEDTPYTSEMLLETGFPVATVKAVEQLTFPKEGYLENIANLCATGSLVAIKVKLADNEDNSNPKRVAAISIGKEMLEKRYKPARRMLIARLHEEIAKSGKVMQ